MSKKVLVTPAPRGTRRLALLGGAESAGSRGHESIGA